MRQFGRKVRVTFEGNGGSLTVNPDDSTNVQQRVYATISKSITGSANISELHIYNLRESSRNLIGREFTNVTIEAGYINESGNSVGQIFRGQIRDPEHYWEGADFITKVILGDGEQAIRRATINRTFEAGTTVEEVVEQLFLELESQGISRGERLYPEEIETFARPYSVSGSVRAELDKLGRSHNFYWSIQNNVFEVMPHNKWLPQTTLVNQNTGMIGYPKLTDNGIKVTSLINPQVRPNRLIQVESDFLDLNADNGLYRVGHIDYQVDSRGGQNSPFYMTMHAESIKDGEVDEGER